MMDDTWVTVDRPSQTLASIESLPDRVRRVQADLSDLTKYYNITISNRRYARLHEFFTAELASLKYNVTFSSLSQQDKVDYILLRNLLRRQLRQLELAREAQDAYLDELIPFADVIVSLCEDRQDVEPLDAQSAAQKLDKIRTLIGTLSKQIKDGDLGDEVSKASAFKATNVLTELRTHLAEFHSFYQSYDPMFDWWATRPWREADAALDTYVTLIKYTLAGMNPEAEDEIVGEPVGRAGLLAELQAEMIAYSPEELLDIAQSQFTVFEMQAAEVSAELGFTSDDDRKNWQAVLEHVKKQYVGPGEQTRLVRELAREGAKFVKDHDLVTVPRIADETYRTFMMSPADQKVAPFFLGGPSILVSYPTAEMSYSMKQMVMRGNNRHFSRAVAFHELIPGHRLQMFMAERHNSHRQAFSTPFYVEGWAMYWELLFYLRGDFFVSSEDRAGSLFWFSHRCARIIFSLKFHLGEWTAEECVDFLVERVGHERATAEGEVRRSFNGEWSPLYQCGYLLGALQMMQLRREVLLEDKSMGEKEFHDTVLRNGMMPVELLRAILRGTKLSQDQEAEWRFEDKKRSDEQRSWWSF